MELQNLWIEKDVKELTDEMPNFFCIGKDTQGKYHDIEYIGFCNGKPRFMQNTNSRPQMFSNIVSYLVPVTPSELKERDEKLIGEAEQRGYNRGYDKGHDEGLEAGLELGSE